MSSRELLERIIEDLEDTIDDYKDDIERGLSRLEAYNRKVQIGELKKWKHSLEITLSELED